ncbi:hypothetical protein GGS20DRAFT_582077 [Poronia punctata]|nr:hypothetical protein GGS20DRAFT_582077 [Poronia punctata]
MGGKKATGGGEGSKKAAGQARKADAAAAKAAAEEAKKAAAEAATWEKGSKKDAKKEAEAAKKAEQARKKAEKDALLAEDEKNTPGRAQPKKTKTAEKKPSRGIDSAFSQLDISGGDGAGAKEKELAASGIDASLEVLDALDSSTRIKVQKHAERKKAAAFEAFLERRDPELKVERPGLRQSQRREILWKEFKTSPENPVNQLHVAHNASKEEIEAAVQAEKERIEGVYSK